MSDLRLTEIRAALRVSRLPALERLLYAAILLMIFCATCLSQQSRFHWDWRRSQELNWDESMRNARVPQATKDAVASAVEARLKDEFADEPNKQLEKVTLDSRVYFVDLNGDGIREVIVQVSDDELCSPTGNCPFWIFESEKGRYKLILERFSAQTFTIQPTVTNGYKDIVTGMHGSAFSSGLTVFRFRGNSYHASGCYGADWQVLEGDKVRELKEPRITPCK